ncbi:MAG TPA: PA0069 family radical SAM protein [Gammaproteobacteria bacterium]
MAGIFDAEGSYSQGVLRISNTDPVIIGQIERSLQSFGFSWITEHPAGLRKKPIAVVRLRGGVPEHLRFFHCTDPAIARKRDIAGTAVKSSVALQVVSIEPVGTRVLYDISTGTGDFIADGVISHNCYARPSHAYLNLSPGLDFETKLFYKAEAARLLDEELRRPSYRVQSITIGANTDPYQPIERKLKVTRSILEVLLRFSHPCTIITKSTAPPRDLDILSEMAKLNLVVVMVTIATLDNDLKRRLEPRAGSPAGRLKVIEQLSAAGVPVGVMTAPIIPVVNDGEMEGILEAAAAAGARGAGYTLLRLPYELKQLFKEWLAEHYPLKAEHVMSIIRQSRGGQEYDSGFGTRMRGTGLFAELIAQRFALATRRLHMGFGSRMRLDTSHFKVPPEGGQLELL